MNSHSKIDIDKLMPQHTYRSDKLLEELKAAAFEVLLLHPGLDEASWAAILMEQYGTEVADAYGKEPAEALASLADLWESPYHDEASGLEYDFSGWAEKFATQADVDRYLKFYPCGVT